jgi:hypothetical protein
MVTSNDCLKKYGLPELEKGMIVWVVPSELHIKTVPTKIYCNRDMVAPLSKAFYNLIDRRRDHELKTWDGCFNIRKKRGLTSMSLHSWGVAVDVNAAWNGLGKPSTMSPEFVKCWTDAGFEWGGKWARIDAMHYQLAKL